MAVAGSLWWGSPMLDAHSNLEGPTLLLQKLIAIAAELPLPK